MLAPIDKVERPGGNQYMQIEITTACNLMCSNCTRLLPFRKDVKHMTVDCFETAVRSLEGWPGKVCIFGGNPPAHPKFAELMNILVKYVPDQRRRGLWANNLLKHGQLIRDVFYPHGTFNLNAHADERAAAEIDRWLPGKLIESSRSRPAMHGPIAMDRRDYALTDAEWVALREACDINRNWSGIIVERSGKPYGYFCEVASSIDGVRSENHGMPALPGWWRSRMDAPEFENQVRQCCDRGCGVPLKLIGHNDREDTYDISPSWKEIFGEPKHVSLAVHDEVSAQKSHETTDYMGLRKTRR